MLKLNKALLLLLLPSILLISCDQKKTNKNDLELLDSYQLSITEASGLSITENHDVLWTVSDEKNKAYKVSLKGKLLSSFKVKHKDLEGITVINDSTLAVVVESTNTIVIADTNGNEIKSKTIDFNSNKNSGLEGITYDKKNKVFYVVSEKNPSFLFKLDENLDVIEKHNLNFAKDYSSVFYDSNKDLLWILSDESKALYVVSLDGKMIKKYNAKIPKPEGVAIDISTYKVYIVSDDTAKLYIFNLPKL